VNTILASIILPYTIAVQVAMIREGIGQMARPKKVKEIEQAEYLEAIDPSLSINEPTIDENPIPTPKEETKMFFTFDEKEAGGFDLLPVGEYEMIVSSTEVTESRAGNPMIKVVMMWSKKGKNVKSLITLLVWNPQCSNFIKWQKLSNGAKVKVLQTLKNSQRESFISK
jgi:hypothetical protein